MRICDGCGFEVEFEWCRVCAEQMEPIAHSGHYTFADKELDRLEAEAGTVLACNPEFLTKQESK